jgi:hypothetical protein
MLTFEIFFVPFSWHEIKYTDYLEIAFLGWFAATFFSMLF